MPACSAQKSHRHKKVMDIFQTLGSTSLSVTDMLNFPVRGPIANTSIHGLAEDDTANSETGQHLIGKAAIFASMNI